MADTTSNRWSWQHAQRNVSALEPKKCVFSELGAHIDTSFKLGTQCLFRCGGIFQDHGPAGRTRRSQRNEWSAGWTSLLIWNSMKTVHTAGVAYSVPLSVFISKNSVSCQGWEQEAWPSPQSPHIRLCELSGSAPAWWQCADCSCRLTRNWTRLWGLACEHVGLWVQGVSTPKENYGNHIYMFVPNVWEAPSLKCCWQ